MNLKFLELKERILAIARRAHACSVQYKRAYSSETAEDLMEVIRHNFHWCVENKVLTISLLEEYRELFTEHGIHLACGNATVLAWGNAYVTSYSTIECRLSDNAIYRIRETNTIRFASDELKFERT